LKVVVNIEGHSALHFAAEVGAVEIIGVLVEKGLNVNRQDNDGLTPLHIASSSALHYAAGHGAVEVMGVLIERGLDVNRENNGGLTPLHLASVGLDVNREDPMMVGPLST
jgi:ankyrin repeat protein